jgi:hypothetical protein
MVGDPDEEDDDDDDDRCVRNIGEVVICMRETEKLHNEEFVTRILHQNILNVIK